MGRQEVSQLLKEFVAQGINIVISSHILAELEALCRNILILNWGRILASGSQKDIRADLKNWAEELSIKCSDPHLLVRHLFNAGALLGYDLKEDDGILDIRVKDPASFYENCSGLFLDSGVTVFSVRSRSQSLKQIFEKVTT